MNPNPNPVQAPEAVVISINEGAPELPVDPEARRIQQMGLMSYNDLAHKYKLLVDDKGACTIVQAIAPGVLRTATKDDVLYCDLIKRWGSEMKPSRVRNDVYPRWYSEMRTRSGATLPYETVKPFRFKSDVSPGWAWQRLAFDPDPTAKAPELFATLMSRTSEEEARSIKLFIGSLFDYKSTRHQYLYLHGLGGDGKSTLIAAMFAMFAKMGVMTMQGDSLDSTHATAALEGIRLVAFPDCNRPSLPSTGTFKQVTGDDMVTINPKGLGMRNITLHCKVVISSNDEPQLAGGNADFRRIIPAKFERKETTASQKWVDDFIASAPQIAQHCIALYNAWRVEHPDAEIPQGSLAMENVRESSTEATALDLMDRIFDFAPEAFTRASTLQETIKRATSGEDKLTKQVMKALKARGLRSASHRVDGEVVRGWQGVGVRSVVVMDR